jgi:hypothetical protein
MDLDLHEYLDRLDIERAEAEGMVLNSADPIADPIEGEGDENV